MKHKNSVFAMSILLVSTTSQGAIITLAQDDFSQIETTDLGLRTADVGGQWQATSNFNQDGSLTTDASGGAAILAFTPTVGNLYTLSVDTVLTSAGGYIGVGFANKNSTNVATTWDTNVEVPNNLYRFSNVGTQGYSWMFNVVSAGVFTQNAYAGPGAGTTLITPVGTSINNGTVTMTITLDTSVTNWVSEMYVNNTLFATTTYVGNGGLLAAIDSVGVTNFASTTGTIDNFLLTAEAIPEPGAALLGGLGILAWMRRSRF